MRLDHVTYLPMFRTRFAHIRAHSTDQTRLDCLSLMRSTAQSVSVITTVLHPSSETRGVLKPVYHGATLSSFASVSMYPYPVVAFALRTPSRMANSLWDTQRACDRFKPHMVINLLSASQAQQALQFSRPREFRHPFASTPYFLSQEHIPVLRGSLGALSCVLIRSLPLDNVHAPSLERQEGSSTRRSGTSGEQGSELFLARVLRVETEVKAATQESEHALPLVYYRQQYVTVQDAESLLPPGSLDSDQNTRTP